MLEITWEEDYQTFQVCKESLMRHRPRDCPSMYADLLSCSLMLVDHLSTRYSQLPSFRDKNVHLEPFQLIFTQRLSQVSTPNYLTSYLLLFHVLQLLWLCSDTKICFLYCLLCEFTGNVCLRFQCPYSRRGLPKAVSFECTS